jgi:glycosyltransferase involved in cell wall biosynthesis
MTKFRELSVFFPAFNEEKNIEHTVEYAIDICKQIADQFEIIIVNDGSTDGTGQKCEELMQRFPEIRTVTHMPNRGYGGALKSGFYAAKYEYVVFTDSDGQFDFAQIRNFMPFLDQYKVVIGYRKKRVEGFLRALNAKAWGTLVNILFGMQIRDVDGAFKVIHREIFEKIPPLEAEGALISTELLVKIKKYGYAIKQVPVDHLPRKAGKPTGAKVSVILKAFRELFALWKKLQ